MLNVTGSPSFKKDNLSIEFDGNDDYLEVKKAGDFSEGFTFEISMNLDRLMYSTGNKEEYGHNSLGLFCKMKSLAEESFTDSMRFGFSVFDGSGDVCVGKIHEIVAHNTSNLKTRIEPRMQR